MKVGNGWKRLGGSVYERDGKLRVHTMGWAITSAGEVINGFVLPESRNLSRAIKICGGNRRRGAMLWANTKEPTE